MRSTLSLSPGSLFTPRFPQSPESKRPNGFPRWTIKRSTQAQYSTAAVPGTDVAGIYHHAALYDMLGAAVLFGVLYWVVYKSGWKLRYANRLAPLALPSQVVVASAA